MPTREKFEKIKERIAKLMRKAESAKNIGSLEEAKIFAAKATELMLKYNLEKSELELDADPLISEELDLKAMHGWNKTEGKWLIGMYSLIARFNFCQVVSDGGSKTPKIWLIGEKQNVEMVMFITSQLIYKLRELRKQRWEEYTGTEKKNTFMRGYLNGALQGIRVKLIAQREEEKYKNAKVTDLVIANEHRINEKLNKMFGQLRTAKTRSTKGLHGKIRGYEDGKNMNINKGIGTNIKMLNQ